MITIRNFTNTKCELEVAKIRLNLLMDRKEQLYSKYFPVTSKPKEVVTTGGKHSNDNMVYYLHELHEVDLGTGKSLAGEIEWEQENVAKLQKHLDNINEALSKMRGIEYELFYEIACNGVNISKAVENIAVNNNLEPQTVWKNYYRKIKKYINKIKYFQNIQ